VYCEYTTLKTLKTKKIPMSFKSLYGSIVYMYDYVYPFIEFIGFFVICTIINILFITYYLLRLIVLFPVYIVNRMRENNPQKK